MGTVGTPSGFDIERRFADEKLMPVFGLVFSREDLSAPTEADFFHDVRGLQQDLMASYHDARNLSVQGTGYFGKKFRSDLTLLRRRYAEPIVKLQPMRERQFLRAQSHLHRQLSRSASTKVLKRWFNWTRLAILRLRILRSMSSRTAVPLEFGRQAAGNISDEPAKASSTMLAASKPPRGGDRVDLFH